MARERGFVLSPGGFTVREVADAMEKILASRPPNPACPRCGKTSDDA